MTQAYAPGDVERLTTVVAAALRRYAVPATATAELINLSENATYLISDAASAHRTVLRVHRPSYSTPAQIASELAWAAALREEAGIRTPEVVGTIDEVDVTVVDVPEWPGPRPCVMFGFCPGAEPPEQGDMTPAFERLGTLAARIHDHAQGWAPPPGFVRRTWDHETTIGARPTWGRWEDGVGVGRAERELLGRVSDAVGAELAAYGRAPDRFGLVHADMRLANLLFDGDDSYVIDFDDCGYGWFLYDLATALTFLEDRPDVGTLIAAWLRGYERLRPVSAADLAVIPALVMLRRLLVVAWIASHAETGIARSEGVQHTRTTCELAEGYLGGSLHGLQDKED